MVNKKYPSVPQSQEVFKISDNNNLTQGPLINFSQSFQKSVRGVKKLLSRIWLRIVFFCQTAVSKLKNELSCSTSNALFCPTNSPTHEDVQFTMTENTEKQQITLEKLQPGNGWCFWTKNTEIVANWLLN